MLKSIGKQSGNAWRSGAQHIVTLRQRKTHISWVMPPPLAISDQNLTDYDTLRCTYRSVHMKTIKKRVIDVNKGNRRLTDWLAGLVWRKALLRAVHTTLHVAAPRAGKNVSPVFSTSKPQPISDRSTVQVNALHHFLYSRVFRYLFYCDI